MSYVIVSNINEVLLRHPFNLDRRKNVKRLGSLKVDFGKKVSYKVL